MPRGFRMGVYVAQTSSDTTVVQYTVDTGEVHYEEFSNGYDVLNPTTFTPTKTGYVFHGWRMDIIPSSVVLSSKIATGGLIRLYAVFKIATAVTVTYYDNDNTAQTQSNYIYYNNGNEIGATFALVQDIVSGWDARGWTLSSSGGSSAIAHQNGVQFSIMSDETLYGCYEKDVTVSYNPNGGTGTQMPDSTGTAYKHSVSGITNADIILSTCTYVNPDLICYDWHLNSASGQSYKQGAVYSSTEDAEMYANWIAGIPVNYYDDSTLLGTEIIPPGNDVLHPTIVMPTKTGYTFIGWATSNSEDDWVDILVAGEEEMDLYAIYIPNTLTVVSGASIKNSKYVSGGLSVSVSAPWSTRSASTSFNLITKGHYATATCVAAASFDNKDTGYLDVGDAQFDGDNIIGPYITGGDSGSKSYTINAGSHSLYVSATSYDNYWQNGNANANSLTLSNPIAWT